MPTKIKRKLQLKQVKNTYVLFDKETGQEIEDVANIEIHYNDPLSFTAKITLFIHSRIEEESIIESTLQYL